MAWLAVNKSNTEIVMDGGIPYRRGADWFSLDWIGDEAYNNCIYLPKGSIEKLIGRKLTWEDEPVEI